MRGLIAMLTMALCVLCVLYGSAAVAESPDGAVAPAETGTPAPTGLTSEQRQAYAATLHEAIAAARALVMDKLVQRVERKADERLDLMAEVLWWFALSGLLLLLLPLWLRRKYPGRGWMLLKHSVLAASLFIGAIVVLAVMLLVVRGVQDGFSELINPQLQIADRAFVALDNSVDDVLELGPLLVEAPLAALTSGGAEDLPVALFENARRIKSDISAFANIARMFSWVKDALGLLPILLAIVVVVLFLLSMKDLIAAIVTLPDKVVSGQATAKEVLRLVLRKVGAESLSALCLMGALLIVLILTGVAMTWFTGPAAESLVAHIMLSNLYIALELEASTALVYLALVGNVVFMTLALVSLILGSVFVLGRLRKIFHARFHSGVPFGHQKRFWGRGTLAFVWVLVLPGLFALAATPLVSAIIDVEEGVEIDWTTTLGAGTLVLVVGFVVVYWLVRGFKAVNFLRKCPVITTPPNETAAVAVA